MTKEEALKLNGCFHRKHEEVKATIFHSSPFFEKRDETQVKYEMLRAVQMGEGSISAISKAFGFTRKSFYRIRSDFANGGFLALLPKKTGPKGPRKLGESAMAFIEEYLGAFPQAKSSEIARMLCQTQGLKVHTRTVHRYIERRNAESE